MSSLKKKVLVGFFWQGLDRFGIQLLTLIFSVFLLRILSPQDYGWMGMILVFYGLSEAIIDGGFGDALIQRKEVSQTDLSTVFWANIAIGIALFCLGLLLAPLIAMFYGEPKLTPLARVLAFSFLLASLNVVQRTLIKRSLNFKALSIINISALICAQGTGLMLAYRDFGVWSLVAIQIINYSIMAIGLWFSNKWRPSFVFSKASLSTLYGFSINVLGFNLLNKLAAKFDRIYIGKFLGVASLGFYENASRLMTKPVSSFSGTFFNVLFPSFSKISEDTEKLKSTYIEAMAMVSFFIFPGLLGLFFSADLIVKLLFGTKWLPMIPLFQIFCIQGLMISLSPISNSIILALGKSKMIFNYGLLAQGLKVFFFLTLGHFYGLKGVALGITINSIVIFFIRQRAINKVVELNFFPHYFPLFKNLIIALIIGFLLFSFSHFISDFTHSVALFLYWSVWTILFFGFSYFFNNEQLLRILNFVKVLLDKKPKMEEFSN